jgi:uncharacterized protein
MHSAPDRSATPAAPVSPGKTAPYFVLAKPAGPACNLRCSYCFYLEKNDLFGRTQSTRMQEDILETFIRDYITAQGRVALTRLSLQQLTDIPA